MFLYFRWVGAFLTLAAYNVAIVSEILRILKQCIIFATTYLTSVVTAYLAVFIEEMYMFGRYHMTIHMWAYFALGFLVTEVESALLALDKELFSCKSTYLTLRCRHWIKGSEVVNNANNYYYTPQMFFAITIAIDAFCYEELDYIRIQEDSF